MQLRSAGQDAQACPKFAQSKRLAPGVGVTLYLADCYERTGRTASAWQEFRDGEKLARERSDKRADVAAARAAALEPKLNRLTVEPPGGEMKAGAEVQLDGRRVPPESLNVALAVDPGDHVVTFASPGQALLTLSAHVDASQASTIVRLGPSVAPLVPAAASLPPAATESSIPSRTEGPRRGGWPEGSWSPARSDLASARGSSRRRRKTSWPTGSLCRPYLLPGAIPEAATAFSAGGVAVLSGILLYYVNRPGRNEVSFSPAFAPGGGGAMLRVVSELTSAATGHLCPSGDVLVPLTTAR